MASSTVYTESVVIVGIALAAPGGMPGQPFPISSPSAPGSDTTNAYVTVRYPDGNSRVIAVPLANAGQFALGASLTLNLVSA